jgi:hypothetical protein
MNYTFTVIIMILLCLLTFLVAPIQNPSLKENKKPSIILKQKQ